MSKSIQIGRHQVGKDHPCFIIAEAGVNHNGSLEMAKQLVDAAKRARADAVKFQTFKAERLVTENAPKAAYQIETTGGGESQFAMIKRLELSVENHFALLNYCKQQDIQFLSTPFDEESADFLQQLEIPAFKLPSGEITNLPLLRHVARMGKPIILSTGMATLGEVETAVQTIENEGNSDLILLQCVSNYPALASDVNLRAMTTMGEAFGHSIGYSDHVPGNEVAFAAVAMGARVIEKHFTLDHNLPGPDHRASLEPRGLEQLVSGIRAVESALGDGRKLPAASESNTASVVRKSLVAMCDLASGTRLTESMVGIKRPGHGLPPMMLPLVIGRTLRRGITKNDLLALEDLA